MLVLSANIWLRRPLDRGSGHSPPRTGWRATPVGATPQARRNGGDAVASRVSDRRNQPSRQPAEAEDPAADDRGRSAPQRAAELARNKVGGTGRYARSRERV